MLLLLYLLLHDFTSKMKEILDNNGVVFNEVLLQSAYIASVSLTFRVDLNNTNKMDNLTQLTSFLNDPRAFSTFGNYTVMEEGRGSLDVTASGKFSIDYFLNILMSYSISLTSCRKHPC